MTHQTEPIRKSSLPTTPPPEWEFFTFFPYPDDDGGDMVRGQRQRGVQVRRLVTYGDWEPVRPDRWADEPESAAVSAAVAPPTNQTALRDRIRLAIARQWLDEMGSDRTVDELDDAEFGEFADAVLAVLPEVADKATVYREAADQLGCMDYDTDSNDYGYDTYRDAWNGGVMDAADRLRRMADETATTETRAATTVPCSGALRTPHQPHNWEPQPGMEPVHCPGTRKPPMDPVHILGIEVDDEPAAGARQDGSQP